MRTQNKCKGNGIELIVWDVKGSEESAMTPKFLT